MLSVMTGLVHIEIDDILKLGRQVSIRCKMHRQECIRANGFDRFWSGHKVSFFIGRPKLGVSTDEKNRTKLAEPFCNVSGIRLNSFKRHS